MDEFDQMKCLQSYVEVLRNKKLSLTGNSVEIKDIGQNKVEIKVIYCETTLKLLVKMDKPLDFLISDSDILPRDYFNDQEIPTNFENLSLNQLLTWILSHVRSSMMSNLEFYPNISPLNDIINSLVEDEIIVENGYDIIVEDERATLLLKFQPERSMDLVNLPESMSSNKLQNVTEQFFILKLVIKSESGQLLTSEFGIIFSPSLISSLPDLDDVIYPGLDSMLKNNDLMTNILEIQRFVNLNIQEAYQGYLRRRSCLMMLYIAFRNNKVFRPSIDTTSMTMIQLGCNHKARNYVWEISLGTNHPESSPKAVWYNKDIGDDRVRTVNLKDTITGFHPNMTDEDIYDATIAMIVKITNRWAN